MIIIKIIILYFIQIRHTDDFPSTGTHLVLINLQSYCILGEIVCEILAIQHTPNVIGVNR